MSSSPGPQLRGTASLAEVLKAVPDPRARRGIRYELAGIIAVALAAVVAGARSFTAIGQWAEELTLAQLAGLGLSRGAAPDASTFRKVLGRLDADTLDQLAGAYLWTRTRAAGGRRVIAVDGKTVRGARIAGGPAPHLVSALDHATGAVLGQLATAVKSNEIPAARDLLAGFDLADVVVTLDAMHTQAETATAILDAGGDYVLTVKGNQPGLHAACKNLPWSKVPAHSAAGNGHGRRVRRTIKVLAAPDWITFPGAAQVAQIRRTVTRAGKKTVEVAYVITSADCRTAPPPVLATWVQGHWAIENRAHWVRDVVYDEDRSQVRAASGPQVMATLRNTAISLHRLAGATSIAAALRHHAANAQRPITLLLTS
jgi:predicted transposase YbfD/YdcC